MGQAKYGILAGEMSPYARRVVTQIGHWLERHVGSHLDWTSDVQTAQEAFSIASTNTTPNLFPKLCVRDPLIKTQVNINYTQFTRPINVYLRIP